MKQHFLTVLAILGTASSVWADPIDLTKAKQIAARYMSEGATPEAVTTQTGARSISATDAPLYIFNRGNDQGFVIISGDDCMPAVLGYTEQGKYDPQTLPPTLLEWIDSYSTMIEQAQAAGAPARNIARAADVKLDITPMVTAHWAQGWPYNLKCPYNTNGKGQAITGCVATAASQVIYYWRKENPKKTLYNTPTYGYGDAPVTESTPAGTPIKYELMQDTYSGSTPEDMNMAVATLMSVVGTSTYLTYSTDGTAGQTGDLVNTFWGQFRLHGLYSSKNSYSQSAWENLIYEDLEKGWPIVYSGVSPTQGGHAVVIDGYRATDNLFHFNFGWGGGGDGYFTVNDANGMNGFNSYQAMVHKIHPNTNLLEATMKASNLCTRMNNTIEAEVCNIGTVAYSGLYLVASKTASDPTSITSANAKDLTTVIPSGETRNIVLTYRPVSAGTYHLYLMDGNANILSHITADAVEQAPQLTLESFKVKNSVASPAEITLDNQTVAITCHTVYDNGATLVAAIANSADATATTPLVSGQLYVYDEAQGALVPEKKLSVSTQLFPSGVTTDLTFAVSTAEQGKLYALSLLDEYSAGSNTCTIDMNGNESMVYFKVQGSDLTIAEENDESIVLKGHWNEDIFRDLAQSSTRTYYDLTAVEEVNSQPEAGNPNALFYLSENAPASGRNIIKGGVCELLQLTYGENYKAKADFTALKAEFDTQSQPLQWNYIALPFDCDVPDGNMARRIRRLTNALISEADAANPKMERLIPYLYKSTRSGRNVLKAENVTVSAAPAELSDTMKVTFTTFIASEGMAKLNKNDIQKFTSARNAVIPAFSGYLNYDKDVEADAFTHKDLDAAAKNLASALNQAYDVEENYAGKIPAAQWDAFVAALNEAAACYTQQPSVNDINTQTTLLTESMNAALAHEKFQGEPFDVTNIYIENPSFEKSRSSATGWTILRESGKSSKVQNVSALADYTVNADGTNVFYSYSATGKGSLTLSQSLTGLTDGIYRLTACLGSVEGGSATLFANEQTATMTDDGFGIRYMTETTVDSIRVEGGTLEIGVKGSEYDYKADNFRLYYIDALESAVTETPAEGSTLRIWSENGAVCLLATESKPVSVSIYSMDGRLCKQLSVEGLRRVEGLTKGIYIVNRQKVLVK